MQKIAYGTIIKNIRRQKGLTQKELASIIGLDKTTISAYEREKIMPPTDIFLNICNVCNVKIYFKYGNKSYTIKDLSREY